MRSSSVETVGLRLRSRAASSSVGEPEQAAEPHGLFEVLRPAPAS